MWGGLYESPEQGTNPLRRENECYRAGVSESGRRRWGSNMRSLIKDNGYKREGTLTGKGQR